MAPEAEPTVVVPAGLAASHRLYFGDAGDRWIARLPGLATMYLQRWQLIVDGPAAFGAVALVLPVRRADGGRAVLKLQPIDDETVGEATALQLWAGRGAVELLDHDAVTGTLLLERLDATRTLLTVPADETATTVIAELLLALHAVPAPPGLRRLTDIAAATLASTPAALAGLTEPADRRLLTLAGGVLGELLAGPVPDRLLHWDLHHSNVLGTLDGRGWRAIDPKPLSGDPGFDLLPALWNRWDSVTATGDVRGAVQQRFDQMTEVLGLERDRAAGWTLARVLQNACWDLESGRATTLGVAHRAVAEAVLPRLGERGVSVPVAGVSPAAGRTEP